MILAALVLYILLQLAIAVWASRKMSTHTDYLVAGRRLGFWAVGISVFATWFGGETIMGSTATIADEGLGGARAEPVGYAICLIVAALFVAGQLRSKGYLTLADFFRDRFGPRAEIASACVSIPTSIIWAAAQLLALASIIAVASDLPVEWALVGASLLVIAYTLLGGLLGASVDACRGNVGFQAIRAWHPLDDFQHRDRRRALAKGFQPRASVPDQR